MVSSLSDARNMNKISGDRSMDAYFADVRECTLLTAEQERAYFRQYRTCTKCKWAFPVNQVRKTCKRCDAPRDYKARDKLIEGALRFVIKVAKDYARRARGFQTDTNLIQTLISAGNLGLLVAVDRFDLTKGTRFLTYAAWWVTEKIREELDGLGIVHVPAYRQKEVRLRRRMGEDVDQDAACISYESSAAIDKTYSDDQLEQNLVNAYGTEMLHTAMTTLGFKGRDRYIILAYFGVREEPKNLRQISSRLNLSSERVRQIKQDVLATLKKYLEEQAIQDSEDIFTG